MKTLLLNLAFLMLGNAYAAQGDVIPAPNQCASIKDSKVYLTSEFHAYPRTVRFECTYICNANGRIDKLTGISQVLVSNMEDDALVPLCQGTRLKKVPWGYDFDKIVPFYAADTDILELKRWTFQNVNFNSKNNLYEQGKLIKLKQDLYNISSTFITTGLQNPALSNFKEAGIILSEIADELPMKTTLLEERIQEIIVSKGRVSGVDANAMVFNAIKNSASWRIPLHLFK